MPVTFQSGLLRIQPTTGGTLDILQLNIIINEQKSKISTPTPQKITQLSR